MPPWSSTGSSSCRWKAPSADGRAPDRPRSAPHPGSEAVTVTESPAIAGAVETSDQVASHLHPVGSFTVEAHPVPTGREEIWRFTPLKRLRGLHQDAALSGHGVHADAEVPDGVSVEWIAADSPLIGSSGFVPSDRVSARAWQAATTRYSVTVPADTVVAEPVQVTVTGTSAAPASPAHPLVVAD